jgi:glutathione S-transferase
MRPWLALTHAGAKFETQTVELPGMGQPNAPSLADRRKLGSVRGLFPVLHVDGRPIHESLAICEYAAETHPEAQLWPADTLRRAEARAVCCEMLTGFGDLRRELSCHLFGRVPSLEPSAAARADIARVLEIWRDKLAESGGPFLFGGFSIADAMFYPVLTRFRTYRVELPAELSPYADALTGHAAVRALVERARLAPRILHYDENLRRLGGDPDATLRSHGLGA